MIVAVGLFDYKYRVWRNALSISAMGKVPIMRSISLSAIVARLSVITTESVSRPDD
jgi:hypothetical protein